MKHLLLSGLVACTLLAVSCKKDNPYDAYKGVWTGSYIGDDTGSFTATIDEDGIISGNASSNAAPGYSLSLKGTVSEAGDFNATASIFIQSIDFTGKLNNGSASGTWGSDSAGFSGTWTSNRQ